MLGDGAVEFPLRVRQSGGIIVYSKLGSDLVGERGTAEAVDCIVNRWIECCLWN